MVYHGPCMLRESSIIVNNPRPPPHTTLMYEVDVMYLTIYLSRPYYHGRGWRVKEVLPRLRVSIITQLPRRRPRCTLLQSWPSEEPSQIEVREVTPFDSECLHWVPKSHWIPVEILTFDVESRGSGHEKDKMVSVLVLFRSRLVITTLKSVDVCPARLRTT